MCIADTHGQCVHLDRGGKIDHILHADQERLGVIVGNVVLRAEDRAQFRLHRGAGSVGDADDLLRNGDVVLEGQLRSVDHHGGKTGAQGFDDLLHALPVIQVQHHRGLHILGQRANCGGQALQLAVLDGCLTDCDDSGTVSSSTVSRMAWVISIVSILKAGIAIFFSSA